MKKSTSPRTWALPPLSDAALDSAAYTSCSTGKLLTRSLEALRNCEAHRMLAVGVTPPPDEAMRLLRFLLLSGKGRVWSWQAQKGPHGGNIRASLAYELGMNPSHVSGRALGPLLKAGVVELAKTSMGRELVFVTELGKRFFTELMWRHTIRDSVGLDCVAAADHLGWNAVAVGTAESIKSNDLEFDIRADIMFCFLEWGFAHSAPKAASKASTTVGHLRVVNGGLQ